MNIRRRSQIVNGLLVAAALGAAVAVALTTGKVTTSEHEARASNVLSSYREDDVSRISVEREGKRFTLARAKPDDAGDTVWNIEEPIHEEADAYAVDKLLGSIEYARVLRRIKPEEVDRAGFGLDAPVWQMQVEMGNIAYTLRLGKEAASPAGAHYMEVLAKGAPGSGVVIVSRDLVHELDVSASELRGRQLVPYLSNLLKTIVIVGSDGTEKKLASAGQDRWRFDGMEGNLRLNRDALDQVLVQFARTRADDFLELPAANAALGAGPALKLTLVPTDPKSPKAVLEIGGKCPKSENDVVAVRREPAPVAACVPKSVMPGLETPASALVDKTPFSLRKDEVESLLITRGDKKLSLDRKENGFIMRSPVKGDVELDAGNRRVESLVRAEGELVASPDLAALGLSPPAGQANVKSAAESEAKVVDETVDLGKRQKDGKLPIRRKTDGAVLLLDADAARAFEPDSTLVRSRKIFDFGSAEFRSLEVTSKELHQKLHREGSGQLVLDLPKGFTEDAGLATAVVDALGSLTADRWVADADDGSFGLGTPEIRARVSFEPGDAGAKEHVLLIGALTTGGAFAELEGEPGVFVVARKVVDALGTWVIDRSVFMATPDQWSRIDIEHGGKKLVLEAQGDRFVRASGIDLPNERVAEIADLLLSLRAEAAVHVGAAKPTEGFATPELTLRYEPKDKGKPRVIRIGAGDSWQGTSVHFARSDDVDASYVIAKSKLRVLFDAF